MFFLLGRRFTVACLFFTLAACAISPRDNSKFISAAYTESNPVVEPVRSVTSFSPALACMDHMLLRLQQPPKLIASKIFVDPTGKSGTAVKELVITSLEQMSLRSKTFRVVDYEVNLSLQDTVQNLSALLLAMNAMSIEPPDTYVSGSISYIDDNVTAKRRGVGLSADGSIKGHPFGADLAFDGDVTTSIIALELHLGEFRTRTLIPGIYSANTAMISKGGGSYDGGGTIFKTGVQFTLANDYSQGSGVALRSLVELGMIELVGKWLGVPYWQCLSLNDSAPEFRRELYSWYERMSSDTLARFAQQRLKQSAYYDGAVDGRSSPALKAAITLFQVDQKIPPTGLLSFPTYEALLRSLVETDVHGRTTLAGEVESIQIEKHPVLHGDSDGPIKIDLTTGSNARPAVGDTLSFAVRLDRSAALRCYYEDIHSHVTQLYPNVVQTAEIVTPEQAISVPDKSGKFNIRFEGAGRESVECYAANPEVFARLPTELKNNDLEPLASVRRLSEIRDAMNALDATSLSVNRVNFDVQSNLVPRIR